LLRCLAVLETQTFEDAKGVKTVFPNLVIPRIPNIFWAELNTLADENARIDAKFSCTDALSSLKKSVSNSTQKYPEQHAFEDIQVFVGYRYSVSNKALEGLVCYGYGASRRMGGTFLSEGLGSENSASLFSDRVSLINAEEWLLQTDYAARSVSKQMRDRLQKQLNQIIEILKRILPDIEDIRIAPADEEIRITAADQYTPQPKAEFLTPYGWVGLSSLGLGYRTSIAWMVDLAVRLFRRYPNSEDPLAEPAIVLVDEIDLHLHPKWQRNIMSFLTERFPNTQFIVTAHSPLVVQAAKDANIVLLRREGDRVVIDNDPEIVDNWRVDQVLTSVFELPTARSAELEPLLLRREELLSKAHLSETDEAELQELTVTIGSLPTAESLEDIEAMNIIRRAAKLLTNS